MMPTHPFHFLANCFSYPEEGIHEGRTEALTLLAADLELDVDEYELAPMMLQDQQAEYVRLFINGPGGVAAPPYASVYINNAGILHQQGYDQALAMYCRAGLEPVDENESPDHISHELTFIGLLMELGDQQLLDTFIQDHFSKWYPAFYERLILADPIPFYKTLAQVTDRCLQQIYMEVFA
ncbi:MAG TPA: hypothetical protein ENK89_07340 [Desulfobulbaceae bacterium]|nr:hypothetical protein [Desulfobulbaceae bacterium]